MAASETPDNVDVKAIAQTTGLGVEQVRYFASRTARRSTQDEVRDTERVVLASTRYASLTDTIADIYSSLD